MLEVPGCDEEAWETDEEVSVMDVPATTIEAVQPSPRLMPVPENPADGTLTNDQSKETGGSVNASLQKDEPIDEERQPVGRREVGQDLVEENPGEGGLKGDEAEKSGSLCMKASESVTNLVTSEGAENKTKNPDTNGELDELSPKSDRKNSNLSAAEHMEVSQLLEAAAADDDETKKAQSALELWANRQATGSGDLAPNLSVATSKSAEETTAPSGLFTTHFCWDKLPLSLKVVFDRQGHRQEVVDGVSFWRFLTRCTVQELTAPELAEDDGAVAAEALVSCQQPQFASQVSDELGQGEVNPWQGMESTLPGADADAGRNLLSTVHEECNRLKELLSPHLSPAEAEAIITVIVGAMFNLFPVPDEEIISRVAVATGQEGALILAKILQKAITAQRFGLLSTTVQECREDPNRQEVADLWEQYLMLVDPAAEQREAAMAPRKKHWYSRILRIFL